MLQRLTFSMKASFLTIIALCTFTIQANARIGETEQQCIDRYGWEVSSYNAPFIVHSLGDRKSTFQVKHGDAVFIIQVTFWKGVSSEEKFTIKDSRISDSQVKMILDAEAANGTWTQKELRSVPDVLTNHSAKVQEWIKEDGSIASCWNDDSDTHSDYDYVSLSTKAFHEAETAEIETENAKLEKRLKPKDL